MPHLVACFDAVLDCDASENFEESLVNVVDHTVVPCPDIAQYEVNSRLVKSVALAAVQHNNAITIQVNPL